MKTKIVVDIDNNPVLIEFEGVKTEKLIYEHNIEIDQKIGDLIVSSAENCESFLIQDEAKCKDCETCLVAENFAEIKYLKTKKLKIINLNDFRRLRHGA